MSDRVIRNKCFLRPSAWIVSPFPQFDWRVLRPAGFYALPNKPRGQNSAAFCPSYHAEADFRGPASDALQRVMDVNCKSDLFANKINFATLKTQSLEQSSDCKMKRSVYEELDTWLDELPGGKPVA